MATKPTGKEDPNEGIGFNMTPMIDVVFQLIIFLMLANDMSRREIQEIALPEALHTTNDGGREPHRVLANLVPDPAGGPPRLVVRGSEVDLAAFQQLLRPEVARAGDDLHVLIRADRRVRWQEVQWVMQACAAPGIGIHRIQFATTNPDAGKGARP
jgi:biopolymer transport protein ExbD